MLKDFRKFIDIIEEGMKNSSSNDQFLENKKEIEEELNDLYLLIYEWNKLNINSIILHEYNSKNPRVLDKNELNALFNKLVLAQQYIKATGRNPEEQDFSDEGLKGKLQRKIDKKLRTLMKKFSFNKTAGKK